jgi:ribulose 1,5-bisphosphate synthetase/thiazole synthase
MNTNMTTADIVAVGAGHNGLVAAAYLATAGKKVPVRDRQHRIVEGLAVMSLAAVWETAREVINGSERRARM